MGPPSAGSTVPRSERGSSWRVSRAPVLLPELTVAPVAGRDAPGETETRRRLARLLELGGSVLLTGFPEVYYLTSYLRRYTREPLRFVLGSAHVLQVLHEAHYRNLMGGLLEALGRLFAVDVKIYVYPMKADAFRRALDGAGIPLDTIRVPGGEWVTAREIRPEPPPAYLYQYLLEEGWIVALQPPASSADHR